MQFRDQVEQMLQCKVNGMCARDGLVTEWLKNRSENFNEVFDMKKSDDDFIIKMLTALRED